MQVQAIRFGAFRPEPPPLWFVTDGETTVGPVLTDLLVRGVKQGRIPATCFARPLRGGWRSLDSIRELRALHHDPEPASQRRRRDPLLEVLPLLDGIRDQDELFQYATQLSVIVTGADAAMLHHAPNSSPDELVTRVALGPLATDRLGQPLPDDLVLHTALTDHPIRGRADDGAEQREIADRLACDDNGVPGVAMIPFFTRYELVAMLELRRPDRAFRSTDLRLAERIVQRGLRSASRLALSD
jgi:hypothetical protein